MKRLLAMVCTLCMLMTACCFAQAEAYTVTEKSIPLYIGSAEKKQDLNVYYINGGSIPYISAGDVGMLIENAYQMGGQDLAFYGLEYQTEGDHAVYTRAGGPYAMDIDFTNDTISFPDYDAFFKLEEIGLVDMVWISKNTAGLYQKSPLSLDRYGKALTFDLAAYGIDLVQTADGYYVPLQTVSDLLISYYGGNVLFNGEAAVLGDADQELAEILASGKNQWDEEFARFNYNALCCALDYQYGLKEIHGIERFDLLFEETGLKKDFLSDDETKADQALYKLISWYLGDLHSTYNGVSYLSDMERMKEMADVKGLAAAKMASVKEELSAARKLAYPDGIPAYEEVGNTAYITFDVFTDPDAATDYFAVPAEADNSMKDTIRLIQYACARILREGSPVENVVLDLSLNGGGSTTAAEYVMAAFLREADSSTKNMMTGAMTNAVYTVDTNLDGLFDEKDTLGGKGLHLYCLESPVSFSCGNLTPNVFKASQRVTLLGKTSGGGSCSVYTLTTAAGSKFNISGFRRFSVMKNGSFYDIDTGAEPDYYIADPEKYYNRDTLTQFINSLY